MKVYLASPTTGINRKQFHEAIRQYRPRYLLETFQEGEKTCTEVLNVIGRENFLLDSGAFSYMNGMRTSHAQIEEYIERYIQFIRANDVRYYFEMDVDKIFGLPQVEEWRRRIEQGTGRPCIPVWHKERGIDYWLRMCREYDYVAIGGLVLDIRKKEYESIRKMVEYAYLRGVKVHGLGFTKTQDLPNYKFYSVDSSSWTVGAVWAQHRYFFDVDHMGYRLVKREGMKTNISKLILHNMSEWIKYQKFADTWR